MSGITLTEVANSTIPTPASGKATLFQSTDEGAPAYKDDGGTVHTLEGAAAPALTYSNHGNTGASEDVDWSAADVHRLVLDNATVAITCSNFPASGTPGVVRLWIQQDVSGGRDLDWSGVTGLNWGEPGEPDWTTRSGGDVDIVDLMTVDGGTTVFAGLMGREGPQGTAGSSALGTDTFWDAKGDLAVGTGSNTAAKLTAGANGKVPTYASGETTGMIPAYPPGYELDYAESTGTVTVTSSTEGSETSVLAGNSVTFDGSAHWIEFYCPRLAITPSAANRGCIGVLYVDSTSQGRLALEDPTFVSGVGTVKSVYWKRKLSPSAGAHTITVKAWKNNASDTVVFVPGAGGAGAEVPMYVRVTKA